MAQLRLAKALAAEAPVTLGRADACGRCVAAGTANGRLYLLALQAGANTSEVDAFALTLLADGTPPKVLEQAWAALALLPPACGSGLLCAQAGSNRLLCCQHPVAALELGQPGAETFLLGCHQGKTGLCAAQLLQSVSLECTFSAAQGRKPNSLTARPAHPDLCKHACRLHHRRCSQQLRKYGAVGRRWRGSAPVGPC